MEAEIRGLRSFFLSITTLCFWGIWAGKQWQWQCSHAESLQSCPTLSHPVDCSPPGSSVHGILQARILEWVTISCSRGSSQPRDQTLVSYVSLIGVGRQVPYHQRHLDSGGATETSSSSSGGYSGDHAQSSRSCRHSENCEWLFARNCAKDKNLHFISHCSYSYSQRCSWS